MVIQAKDMGGHMGGLSGSTTVTVTLSDVNDNPPKFPQSKRAIRCPDNPLIALPSCFWGSHQSPVPPQPDPRTCWGRGRRASESLRTPLPPCSFKVYTSSLWWRQLDLEPWWAGLRPRTQTWGTMP